MKQNKISVHHHYNYGNENAKQHFSKLLNNCTWLKGCVAFWTITPDLFNGKLAEVLSKDESFYCIHLSSPTNHYALDQFHNLNANLFSYNIFWKSQLQEGIHPPLLHAKVAMFGLPDDEVVIWIGSHNFTASAIHDINIEASTVIRTDTNSEVYRDVLEMLMNIKRDCTRYDPKIAKWLYILQGKGINKLTEKDIADLYGLNEKLIEEFHRRLVIHFVGKKVDKLDESNDIIQVIGLDNQFNQALSVKQKEVVIYVQDAEKKRFYVYVARIMLTGDIDEQIQDSYDMELSERRYCALESNLRGAFLNPKVKIGKEQLKAGVYTTGLKITRKITELKIFPFPNQAWQEIDYHGNQKQVNPYESSQLLAPPKEKQGSIHKMESIKFPKFKKLQPDVEAMTIEETVNVDLIEETVAEDLINYYLEKLRHLDFKQRSNFENQVELKFAQKAPKPARLKQSTNHRIVVEMKKSTTKK